MNIIYLDFSSITETTLQQIALRMPNESVEQLSDNVVYKRSVLSRWLVSVLFKRMGIENTDILLGEFGKPYLASDVVHFNISHSNSLLVAAASLKGPIGIDVEFIHNVDWQQYETSFSPQDWQIIQASSNPSKEMLMLWTKMESIVKADGRGLQLPFTDITIVNNSAFIGDNTWHTKPILLSDYACHACSAFPLGYINIDRLVTVLPA